MGSRDPMGSGSYRRTLPVVLAQQLALAKQQSRLSFRQLERATGLDNSYLARLCNGTRCPSTLTAEKLIAVLPLDSDTVDWLRAEAVVRRYPGSR